MRCLILGNAKSGTTALFYAIANSIPDAKHYFEEPLFELESMPLNSVAKIIFEVFDVKEIENSSRLFDKKIAIIRDPRDNLVSRVLYSVAEKSIASNDSLVNEIIRLIEKKQSSPQDTDFLNVVSLICGSANVDRFLRDTLAPFNNLIAFLKRFGDWFVLPYEKVIERDLGELSDYLSIRISKEFAIDNTYSRVARTKSYGDWKNWFTVSDIGFIKPLFSEALCASGYEDNWEIAESQSIESKNGAEYVRRVVESRRQQFGLPPLDADNAPSDVSGSFVAGSSSETANARSACPICGGADLGPGPNRRISSTGIPPCCKKCGSLERHRVLRRLFEALPTGFVDWRKGIQFSRDEGIDRKWFRSFETSIFGGENSLDLQEIERPNHGFDFISLNHVLESVPDDRLAFRELCRILSPQGVMQICFGSPMSRDVTADLTEPQFEWKAHHLYGRDLVERFRCRELGLTTLAVDEMDPCTGVREVVHFFFKDAADALRVRAWIGAWSETARILN